MMLCEGSTVQAVLRPRSTYREGCTSWIFWTSSGRAILSSSSCSWRPWRCVGFMVPRGSPTTSSECWVPGQGSSGSSAGNTSLRPLFLWVPVELNEYNRHKLIYWFPCFSQGSQTAKHLRITFGLARMDEQYWMGTSRMLYIFMISYTWLASEQPWALLMAVVPSRHTHLTRPMMGLKPGWRQATFTEEADVTIAGTELTMLLYCYLF